MRSPDITRAGWIELLAERYSLDDSYSNDPYLVGAYEATAV
jgi:hypothetical protein